MIKVGQKVRFDPFRYLMGFGSTDCRGTLTTGTIVMINWQHGWFSVEYGNPKLRTSFKFVDIGEEVKLIG